MTGLWGTSPWGRDAIAQMDQDERNRIVKAIPPSYSLTVQAERSRGVWSVRLWKDDVCVDKRKPAYDIANACWSLLEGIDIEQL